jgi:hypothetical protein
VLPQQSFKTTLQWAGQSVPHVHVVPQMARGDAAPHDAERCKRRDDSGKPLKIFFLVSKKKSLHPPFPAPVILLTYLLLWESLKKEV